MQTSSPSNDHGLAENLLGPRPAILKMAVTVASEPRHAGSLHPGELAHAAVMAALCVATAIIAAPMPSAACGT